MSATLVAATPDRERCAVPDPDRQASFSSIGQVTTDDEESHGCREPPPDCAATFRLTRTGPVAQLAVAGRVGARSAGELRRELRDLVLRGERAVVIDLDDAEFDGPSGPAALVVALRVMRAHGGTIKVADRPRPGAYRVTLHLIFGDWEPPTALAGEAAQGEMGARPRRAANAEVA